MNRLQTAISLSMLSIAGLTGCAGLSGTAPLVQPDAMPLGNIRGSNFGGHAPVVGAHVYVLQASTAGYGTQATSLLNATYNSTYLNASGVPYATTANVNDPKIPTTGTGTPWYYETTDNLGAFNISGDYTCTQGLPVYLYAYGGTAAIAPSSVITSYTITGGNTVNFSGYNLLSVGQQVNFSGLTGNASSLNTGGPYTIATSTLTGFTVTKAGLTNVGATAQSGALVTPVLTNNPNIVQLALLGNCPSGTTDVGFSGTLNYVYMNEVSTIATAYALSGFMTDSATALTSTDATHLGIPLEGGFAGIAGGTSPAWQGIEQAADNAAILYNIQGTVNGTSGDGEMHIANSTLSSTVLASTSALGTATPAGTVNATVPQALINTMADVLATCVDSDSTSTTTSTACTTLFGKVESSVGSGGVPAGTAPVDTATVALDMAHNPGNSNASTLLGLATGTVPYTPTVTATASKDLVIGITWPVPTAEQSGVNTSAGAALGVAKIDSGGLIWVGSYQEAHIDTSGYVIQYDRKGNQLISKPTTYNPVDEAFDSAGNLWVLPNDLGAVGTGVYKYTAPAFTTATYYNSTTVNNPESIAIDGTNNVYLAAYSTGEAIRLNSAGTLTCLYNQNSAQSFATALDKLGNFYFGAWAQGLQEYATSNCAVGGGNAATYTSRTAIAEPHQAAVDQNGHIWVTDRTPSTNATPVSEINVTANTQTAFGGGGLASNAGGTTALVVDGDDRIIIGTRGGTSIPGLFTMMSDTGVFLTTTSGLTGNYTISGGSAVTTSEAYYYFAVDGAGNLWSNGATELHEYIGVAAPVLTPLSAAVKNGTIAAKP